MTSIALSVRGLSKVFSVPRAHGSVADPRREAATRRHDRFWVLRDLSFEIPRGQTLGLIGPNGSGKSTLLKILGGVMIPDSGSFVAQGRIGALLELGAGFHPELSGVQNIFLTGTLMGLTHAQISRLLPEIIGFSELERSIDLPVKHFSSGMVGRLGFSVASHLAPEILLMDETFATGDAAFQAKALAHIADLKARGHTMILVSHNMEMLMHMADALLWIDRGQVRRHGNPREVLAEFRRSQQTNLYQIYEMRSRLGMEALFEPAQGILPSVRIESASLHSGGRSTESESIIPIAQDETVSLRVRLAHPATHPARVNLHTGWVHQDNHVIAESRTAVPLDPDKDFTDAAIDFQPFPLTEATWRVALGIAEAGGADPGDETPWRAGPPPFLDRKLDSGGVRVTTPNPFHLPAPIPIRHRWSTSNEAPVEALDC